MKKNSNKNKRPLCYSCKWRQECPGSVHSRCGHPSAQDASDKGEVFLQLLLGNTGYLNPKGMNIKANPHGVRNGWFIFPINFDPVWLENCDGYEKKDTK